MTLLIPLVWLATMFAARFLDPLPTILVPSITMAIIVVVNDRRRASEWMRLTPPIATLSLAAALLMVGTTYVIFPLLVRTLHFVRPAASAIYATFLTSGSVALTVAGVVPVILAEEVLWRGRFQDAAGRWSVIVTPLVYAAAHLPLGSLLLVAVAFVCGVYWSALRAISGSLIPPLCAHLAWDVALIVFPLLR